MRTKLYLLSPKIITALALLGLFLILSGCEAQLDLDGVNQEMGKSLRRTDQFQDLTTNGTVITAVGSAGLILTSPKVSGPEEPLQWTRTELEGQPNFIDIDSCPDNSMVALAVERQIWISTNNGQHWTKSDLPTQEDMISLTCTPNGDYWVVGSFSTLLHSADKGASWNEHSLGEDAILTQIQFFDAQNGFLIGEFGLIAKTEDGGQNWQSANTIPGEFYPVGSYFADPQRGWVAGLDGVILHTSDGGDTWERQETPTNFPLYGFHAKDDRLFAFGDHNTVLELNDQHWVPLDTPHSPAYVRDGGIIADDLLLVAGGRGTLFTVNIKQAQLPIGSHTNAK